MTARKILIVNDGFPPSSWGGANTIALLHARGLRERGYEVKVFATTRVRAEDGWTEYDGLPVRFFYTDYHPRWWAYRSLYNREVLGAFGAELAAFAPDVVHFHNLHQYFSYHAIALAKRSGAKVFLTAHDVMSFAYQKLHHFIDYSSTAIPRTFRYRIPWQVNLRDARKRFNPLRNPLIRFYLRKADQVFAVSDALRQALEENGIRGNVSVAYNGLAAESFGKYFDKESFAESLGLSGTKVVLFVGRFTPDKGRDVLLRAFARVAERVSAAKLLVVGFDPAKQQEPVMEQLIDELGIRSRIVFVPHSAHEDIYKYYRLADVVAVPSIIFDSFPTANLEAMAAGKPVVATCFGGSFEAVEDGKTGFIVNPLDMEMLAEKLAYLLQNEEQAAVMGEAGLKRLRENFSLEKQLSVYEGYYL